MASVIPGDTIEARCTRCNDVTGHVVVVVVNGEILKVECRACGSLHKYYPPANPKKTASRKEVCRVKPGEDRKRAVNSVAPGCRAEISTASKPASSKAAKATKSAKPKVRKDSQDFEEAWQRSLNLTAATPRPYAMDATFANGDVLDHSVFGLGVVQETEAPNKITVLFRDGVKMLRCVVE